MLAFVNFLYAVIRVIKIKIRWTFTLNVNMGVDGYESVAVHVHLSKTLEAMDDGRPIFSHHKTYLKI